MIPFPAADTIRIEVCQMRLIYPGQLILPLMLVLAGVALMLDSLDIIQISHLWNLWPVALIAAGVEELWLWASPASGKRRRDR